MHYDRLRVLLEDVIGQDQRGYNCTVKRILLRMTELTNLYRDSKTVFHIVCILTPGKVYSAASWNSALTLFKARVRPVILMKLCSHGLFKY